MRLHIGRELELCHGLLVALEDLDGVPALLLLRHLMHSDLFDVGQRMLDRTGECVHRNGLRALGGLDGSLGGFHDTGALQGRDLDDLAAKLTGQLCGVDLIAVLADDVHHVDGDDDRDAQLGELRGEVQVALEVRAVDDVQDRIGTLADQVVTGDDLLQRVRGQGVDTGKVGDRHTVVLLELAFLFSTVTPGQLPTNWLEPVSALNSVVLPLFGLPARAIRMFILLPLFPDFSEGSLG